MTRGVAWSKDPLDKNRHSDDIDKTPTQLNLFSLFVWITLLRTCFSGSGGSRRSDWTYRTQADRL